MHNDDNKCNVYANEHDLQAIMYQIVFTWHSQHNNRNKTPAFPGFIWSNLQNIWYNHLRHTTTEKIWQWGRKDWYFQFDHDNKTYKYNLWITKTKGEPAATPLAPARDATNVILAPKKHNTMCEQYKKISTCRYTVNLLLDLWYTKHTTKRSSPPGLSGSSNQET